MEAVQIVHPMEEENRPATKEDRCHSGNRIRLKNLANQEAL
jgi:hypothetical protein